MSTEESSNNKRPLEEPEENPCEVKKPRFDGVSLRAKALSILKEQEEAQARDIEEIWLPRAVDYVRALIYTHIMKRPKMFLTEDNNSFKMTGIHPRELFDERMGPHMDAEGQAKAIDRLKNYLHDIDINMQLIAQSESYCISF